jgi:hypothetical protein
MLVPAGVCQSPRRYFERWNHGLTSCCHDRTQSRQPLMSLRVRESTQPNVRVGYLLRVPDLYLLHRWHTDSGQQLTEIAGPLSAITLRT